MKTLFSTNFFALPVILALLILITGCGNVDTDQGAVFEDEHLVRYGPEVTKWAEIFSPSVLSHKDRLIELDWFRKTAAPFLGRSLVSVGEDIETSFWESQFLAPAFKEITGIAVRHDVMGEGDVVAHLMEQLEHNVHHYDVYVSDADLIGTHLRMQKVVVLSDYMAGKGEPFTNPRLDMDDFLNLEFGQDYDGNQLQIPDYQFSLVYWFRYDWFSDPAVKSDFKKQYGYELGVPLNWSAYQDTPTMRYRARGLVGAFRMLFFLSPEWGIKGFPMDTRWTNGEFALKIGYP
jgi:ABC-type glycerol-3-phosphate transport system substrate-binding protein